MAAQLEDADLDRDARARRGLLEDERDGPAGQRARGERRRLELERAVEQRVQLGGVSSAPVRKWRGKSLALRLQPEAAQHQQRLLAHGPRPRQHAELQAAS